MIAMEADREDSKARLIRWMAPQHPDVSPTVLARAADAVMDGEFLLPQEEVERIAGEWEGRDSWDASRAIAEASTAALVVKYAEVEQLEQQFDMPSIETGHDGSEMEI